MMAPIALPLLGCRSISRAAEAFDISTSALARRVVKANREGKALDFATLFAAYGGGRLPLGRPKGSLSGRHRTKRSWKAVKRFARRALDRDPLLRAHLKAP